MNEKQRGYSDRQVKEIIRKASRLENEEITSERLFTLEEIQSIGRDLDIHPDRIHSAAIDVAGAKEKGLVQRPLGAPATIQTSSVIKQTVTKSRLENMLSSMNHITSMNGTGSVTHNSLFWRTDYYEHQKRGHAIDVDIVCNDEETTITVKDRIGGIAWGIFGGIMGGFGLGAGLGVGIPVGLITLESLLFIVLFPVFTLTASFLMSRVFFKAVARKKEQNIKKMMGVIVQLLSTSGER